MSDPEIDGTADFKMKAIYNIKPCPNFRHKPASLDELVAELEEARDTHWLPTFTLVFDSNDDEIYFPWDFENKKQVGWGCCDAKNHYYRFDVDVDKMSMRECLENCWLYGMPLSEYIGDLWVQEDYET